MSLQFTDVIYLGTATPGGGGGSSLPDQTGHSGEFLTTDGTDASWAAISALQNTATGTLALTILGTATNVPGAINIGSGSSATQANGVAVGRESEVKGAYSLALGAGAKIGSNYNQTIQLGEGTNLTQGSFQVKSYTMMSADGTIPSDRLVHAINKYSSMPTAASTNEGWIVQFTGTTDSTYTHGHLYECVSDGQTPPTYSWTEVSMGGGSSLPSQTGNSGKFLTTDGTAASWSDKPLVNTATGTDSLTIFGTATTASNVVNIGKNSVSTGMRAVCVGENSQVTQNYGVAIGYNAQTAVSEGVAIGQYAGLSSNGILALGGGCKAKNYGCAIGRNADVTGTRGIAIGDNAKASANNAIQLGGYYQTNSDANTFKVANANGNYEMMSADGTIPSDRLASTTGLADGNYRLRLTMASGVPTLSWVAE